MNAQNWLILSAVALGIGIGKAMNEREEEKKKVVVLKKVIDEKVKPASGYYQIVQNYAQPIASAKPNATPVTPPRRTTR